MKKTTFLKTLGAMIVPAIALTACSEDEPAPDGGSNIADGKYVFATTVKGSNATSYARLFHLKMLGIFKVYD